VVVVGVNLWDKEREARAFVKEFDLTYPNGLDAGGATAIDYGVRGIPETYAVDRDGQLVRRWMGPLSEPQLTALLEGIP
jgi:cytochrome c biogenesis protein CcmG/thiol:disulfide interchange protein DsbE